MKQKKWFKKAVSSMLTAVTLFTTVITPVPALAADEWPEDDLAAYVDALPLLEEVSEQLDPSEKVTADSYAVESGAEIDLSTDFTNITYDSEKVKVSFFEAKNPAGQNFTTSHADNFKATYYAEPYSGNPAYKFSRTVTVTEPVIDEAESSPNVAVEEPTETTTEESGDEDPDIDLSRVREALEKLNEVCLPTEEPVGEPETSNPVSEEPLDDLTEDNASEKQPEEDETPESQPDEGLTREEMNALLEEAKDQETTDWETGVTISGVLIWASEKERINLLGMDNGDSVSFEMPTMSIKSASRGPSTEYVSITKGENFYYETYGLGTYVTSPYFIQFGNVSTIAFCVQPALPGPGDGVYTIEQVWDNADLAKVIYYAAYAKGSENFFDAYYPYYDQVVRFIITHIAASYANGSSDAFTGANETAQELAMQLYYYAVNQPEIPDMSMSFSNPSVVAYKDSDGQRTENVTFYADSSQSIVMNLPAGVVFHNVTTGATSAPGASVTVPGGTTFYLSAPMSQTGDSGGSWSSTMHGNISEDYAAYKITTGWDVQDLAFVFGETSEHELSVSFHVTWLSGSRIVITKKDAANGKALSGAVFGVYSDPACSNLIVQMPETDASGRSAVEITATQNTMYLKEIKAPSGYVPDVSAYDVNVVAGQDSNVTITNEREKTVCGLTVYKEGEVLASAASKDDGVIFRYENQRLPGAVFRVTAGADILDENGAVVYQQGAVVADNLMTGSDGSASLTDLYPGTYAVTEISAPKNYLNEGLTKQVDVKAEVNNSVSFSDDRQKVRVELTKEDSKTNAAISGALFGLYAGETILNYSDQIAVEKDALLATAVSGDNGAGVFDTDLPLNYSYYIKELKAPYGYSLNTAEIFSFKANYTNEKEPVISFSHTFKNDEIHGGLTIYKEGEVLTGASINENGVSFLYEKRRLPGASYQVTAGVDIIAADGSLLYREGDVVADSLTTGSDGSAILTDLHFGTYVITEIGAPKNYINDGRSKKTTLSMTEASQELPMGTVTFVNERQKVLVEVEKKDKMTDTTIPGAVFGLYAGENILDDSGMIAVAKDTLISKTTTGNDGMGVFNVDLPLNTMFYVKELTAPAGYKLNNNDIYSFTTDYTNEKEETICFSHTFTNEEILGSLTICKEGEVLTGVNASDDGVDFQYEGRKLAGAIFNVYAGDEIKSAGGKVIYKKGDLVAEKLVTGADGSVTLDGLYFGTYIVTETVAPENFVKADESKTVTLSPDKSSGTAAITFRNDRQKVAVEISKVDDTTRNPLSGAVYGLYAADTINSADGEILVRKDSLIAKATTESDGKAVFNADLPLNASYYVKELQAPKKYVRNEDEVFTFTAAYSSDDDAEIKFSYTFENARVNARIDLTKLDTETELKTQGDATLEGASYGLYAREDIVHPDGKTGVIFEKDTQVATLTTDKDGKAFVENLYLGKYYIKEIVPSEGYLLDATEYDLDCNEEDDTVKTVQRAVTSKEQVIKQPFQIIKAANNGKTDADLMSGVGFSAYLISSLRENADGSYDFSEASPVVLTPEGKTEIFTDDRGHAHTIPLPYGKYLVRETTTPHNFKPVDDFVVTISENNPTEPQVWRVLLDGEFSAKLKIVKKDDETKRPVLIADTEFKVYDLDNNKYVEQVTTYPETTVHKSFFTDANGYLILPENILPGHYRIEEIKAPEGYILGTSVAEVVVDSDTAYEMDSVSHDAIITVELENHPVKGRLEITKKGEALKGYGKDFLYELQPLAGAELEIYAAEDIYTPDHQVDANNNRLVIYAKDTLVSSVVTDENGKAAVENLPLGSYYVKEVKAPNGFVLNKELQPVTFYYKDQNTPVVERSLEFINERQKAAISVEKQDAQNGNKVAGAVFGLYSRDAISVNGKVIVAADKLLQEVTTDANGLASFQVDVPLGYRYYVKEIKAPSGFIMSDEVLDFAPTYQGQELPIVTMTAVKANESTKVAVTKSDITTGVELDGATLTVLDKKGHVVERWTSERNKPHVIQYLTVGETYTLREEYAPYGYLTAKDVSFTVQDTTDIQKVEMKDEVPKARLIITKKGEFLDKVTAVDNAKGVLEHLFGYVSGSLSEVTFEVYAAEDIKAADGISANYYAKDALVGKITTDSKGIATLDGLPVGKYYVKEVSTAHGYVLDQEVRTVDLSYRDQNTPVVSYDENWQNNRQKATIHIQKTEKNSKTPLAGAVFGLYAAEDIKSAAGKTLVKKDSLIEMKTTDAAGQITFISDLPADGKYYVQEVYAPAGYVTDQQKKDFAFDSNNAAQAEIVMEYLFENAPTTAELSKQDVTTGKELPGAHMELRDEAGNLIDEWISEDKPHTIQKLIVGKKYTLTETKPADGYVSAERITFKIEDTYEVQKIVMKDDVTKVEISKTDITTGKELPGAKLTILDKDGKVIFTWVSSDKPNYITKLPVGDYTLCEETAPNGYLRAENVKFSVKDTGEIQKVVMKDTPVKAPENHETPKTGDEHKPLFWIGVGVLGIATLVLSVVLFKKRRYY